MMRIATFIILLAICSNAAFAQSKLLKDADKLYEKEAYVGAIPLYEKALHKGDSSTHLVSRLADACRKVAEFEKAETYYQLLVDQEGHETQDLYYFAEVLMANQKYEEATGWMAEYHKLSAGDSRAAKFMKDTHYIDQLLADSIRLEVHRLEISSEFSDFGPAYYQDKIVFSSARKEKMLKSKYQWNGEPFLDLYVAQEQDKQLVNPMVFSTALNSDLHEGPVVFSKNGSVIFFTRNNFTNKTHDDERVNRLKILTATQGEEDWVEETEMPWNSPEYSTGHPAVDEEATTLYFASDMPGGYGGSDLYVSTYRAGSWSTPQNLGKAINTEGNEMFPFLHSDGTLYFASDGHPGLGGMDLFYAIPEGNGFSDPANFGYPVNSSKDDFGMILNEAKTSGYFASNRQKGSGDDLYRIIIHAPPVKEEPFVLAGRVTRKKNQAALDRVQITIQQSGQAALDTVLFTDNDGRYQIPIEKGPAYQLSFSKEDYTSAIQNVITDGIEGNELVIDEQLQLLPYTLTGICVYRGSEDPVSDVKIILQDNDNPDIAAGFSGTDGTFAFPLLEEHDYQVRLEKNDLLIRTAFISTKGMRPGVVEMKEYFEMDLLKEGYTIEIEIYFDLGKSDIRPDAAETLDKEVIQLLKDNPQVSFEFGAHTDSRGSASSNLNLSEKRANSAEEYILSKNIKVSQISSRGYGETQLKNKCKDGVPCSEDLHQQNRRVEIKILDILPIETVTSEVGGMK